MGGLAHLLSDLQVIYLFWGPEGGQLGYLDPLPVRPTAYLLVQGSRGVGWGIQRPVPSDLWVLVLLNLTI